MTDGQFKPIDTIPEHSRILILKPSSLGDIVHTLPLAHAIRRCAPTSTIGWVVQKPFKSLLEGDSAVNEIFSIDIPSTSDPAADKWSYLRAFLATIKTLHSLRQAFRQNPYNFVLDLHASLRSGMISIMNPGGQRIGFSDAKELNFFFQHSHIGTGRKLLHAQDKNLLFSYHLHCLPKEEDFYLETSNRDEKEVNKLLAAHAVKSGEKLIYFNPVGRWSSKYWPEEKWAELGDKLRKDLGAVIILGGGGNDKPHLEKISALMNSKAIITAGKLSLPESSMLLSKADLYVGIDSGPMHIAALAGTPVVALFGPTDPKLVGPYGVKSSIVRNESLACLACRKRNCSDLTCMHSISTERVFHEITSLLRE